MADLVLAREWLFIVVYTYEPIERVKAAKERLRPTQRFGKSGGRLVREQSRELIRRAGRVWETYEAARQALESEQTDTEKYAVYAVKAQWVRDTQPDPRSYDPEHPEPKAWRFLTRWAELADAESS